MLLKKHISILFLFYKYIFSKTKIYFKGNEKSILRKLIELIYFFLKEGEFHKFYYAMGFNIKGTDSSKFIGKKRVFKLKETIDTKIKEYYSMNYDYDIVTKDKFYANSILKANCIPCLENLAFIRNNEIITNQGKVLSIEQIKELGKDFLLKNTILEASEGIIFLRIKNNQMIINQQKSNLSDLKNKIRKGLWVVQEKISSHPDIQKINSTALNVIRIVTILEGFEPLYLGGFQAFAIDNAETDSWSEGSIYIGFDLEKEVLKKYGFHSPWFNGKGLITHHPDSGIKFENFKVPFLKEAVDLCLKAHRLFYTNFLLGWDVAVTPEGPKIVEINEKPGMNAVQLTNENIKFKISKFLKNY